MTKATKMKQFSFELPDKPGLLCDVTCAIQEAGASISSICAYAMDDKASFMLITDGNAKAKKTISKLGVQVKEEDVVAVEIPNKAGELDKVAEKLADADINLNYLFGTASTAKTATIIFSSSDNKKAIRVINK